MARQQNQILAGAAGIQKESRGLLHIIFSEIIKQQ